MNAPEQLFELVDVVRVQPEGGYRLALAFSDGTEGERDFADTWSQKAVRWWNRCAIRLSSIASSSTMAS